LCQHATAGNLIWNVTDDVLRDVYVRAKYRDVILGGIGEARHAGNLGSSKNR